MCAWRHVRAKYMPFLSPTRACGGIAVMTELCVRVCVCVCVCACACAALRLANCVCQIELLAHFVDFATTDENGKMCQPKELHVYRRMQTALLKHAQALSEAHAQLHPSSPPPKFLQNFNDSANDGSSGSVGVGSGNSGAGGGGGGGAQSGAAAVVVTHAALQRTAVSGEKRKESQPESAAAGVRAAAADVGSASSSSSSEQSVVESKGGGGGGGGGVDGNVEPEAEEEEEATMGGAARTGQESADPHIMRLVSRTTDDVVVL